MKFKIKTIPNAKEVFENYSKEVAQSIKLFMGKRELTANTEAVLDLLGGGWNWEDAALEMEDHMRDLIVLLMDPEILKIYADGNVERQKDLGKALTRLQSFFRIICNDDFMEAELELFFISQLSAPTNRLKIIHNSFTLKNKIRKLRNETPYFTE